MPAVVVPSSPALRNFGPPHSPPSSNGSGASRDELSVADIKEKVKKAINGFKGVSALALLRAANDQAADGVRFEMEGDLRSAYRSLYTAAQLVKAVIDHPEFKQEAESGKKGVVTKEFQDHRTRYGNEITRLKILEDRLLELEQSKGDSEMDSSVRKVGGSIADRMKSLQDAGMSVQPTKRFSRDLSTPSNAISRASSSMMSPPPTPSMPLSNQHTGSSAHSHSFVAPASLGPPSPTSSTSSSPRLPEYSLAEFNQTFPSIDELDEHIPQLPSVPTNKPGAPTALPSPSVIQRFPSIPRPASTPITPTTLASLQSRPPSPTPARHPQVPAIPPKPAKLSMNGTGGGSASSHSPSGSASISPQRTPANTGDSLSQAQSRTRERSRDRGPGPDLPVTNSLFPKKLHEYLQRKELKVLLLDVRTREEFSKGHIKADAVVCLEPYVLLRDGLSGDKLEDALSVAPRQESMLFQNREKFDLVVMYDADSQSFGPSIAPMSAAVRVIYETEFKRMLKHPPVILVGGLRAWRAAYPTEVEGMRDEAPAPLDKDMGRLQLSSPTTNGSTSPALNGSADSPHELWSPTLQQHRSSPFTMDQIPEDPSFSHEINGAASPEGVRRLARKPAITRPPSTSSISFNVRGLYDNSPPFLNGQIGMQSASSSSIAYPQFTRPTSSSAFGASFSGVSSQASVVSPPPQASINPSPLSRRRSDYIDQSEQAVSMSNRPSIDYPDLSMQHVVRPPPAAATPSLERQDNRPRVGSHGHRPSFSTLEGPKPPMINSEYPVVYWPDTQIATVGLKNLGNTCYMNSTLQCLSATVPFARFFTDGRWKSAVNMVNPLGTKGQLTLAFASLLRDLRHEEVPTITPYSFRKSICVYAKQFAGSEQHDSQEFLGSLMDGLHEDLNRILQKPPLDTSPEREAELEVLPQQIASQQEWTIYRMRNDSIVVDYFQGQFRNRMECMTCKKTSTTYNTFMYLSLPIPAVRGTAKVSLQQCLDAFVKEEVMEKADAWHCPNCKQLRKAIKHLSLSRLPPVLLIHLKRFMTKGHFTDKLETHVDFPLLSLDLTNYMPPPLPPGTDRKSSVPINLDDPRSQIPPYGYDLYGVTNHFGTLSSGHYTAFVKSRGSWLYCDDSRVTPADSREVVGKPAYILFYKRVKS